MVPYGGSVGLCALGVGGGGGGGGNDELLLYCMGAGTHTVAFTLTWKSSLD